MSRVRVRVGARLHFGFQNLSLARERLYGGIGVALDSPRIDLTAEPASEIRCEDPLAADYAERARALFDVPGISIDLHERLPRHVGLGSGTQLALAVLTGVARAHDREPAVRTHAPALGRGGRSGVGVATFERGGFVIDAGHPTSRFTTDPPVQGEWTVPTPMARHALPDDWRFVVAIPEAESGRSGTPEIASIDRVIERADPTIADDVARLVARRLLPAAAEGDWKAFGGVISRLGRRNGAWYADEQGGVYRPPLGAVIERLASSPAIAGAGQSSWGPAIYGLTDADRAESAVTAAHEALSAAGVDGAVVRSEPRDHGATVDVTRP